MGWHEMHLVSMLVIGALCHHGISLLLLLLLLTPLNVLLDARKQPCRDCTLLLGDAPADLQALLHGVPGILLAHTAASAECQYN